MGAFCTMLALFTFFLGLLLGLSLSALAEVLHGLGSVLVRWDRVRQEVARRWGHEWD